MAKKKRKSNNYLIVFVCGLLLIGLANLYQNKEGEIVTAVRKVAQTLGVATSSESVATGTRLEIPASLTQQPEVILHRTGYTVSYNAENKIPNWVAWELTPEKLIERVSRTDKFLPDPDIPVEEAATTNDYRGAGIDRGHMCPAGDNRWDRKAMIESFYMTNICPQNHNLNRGDWKELEEACRGWANKEGKIYIVCGPILYQQKHRCIGAQQVVVPEAFFKVILCMGNRPKAIGFIYKNSAGNQPLDSYVNSVDQVERITKIDFFPALPDDVEESVESAYHLQDWSF